MSKSDPVAICPFVVAIDTREQHPFSFRGIISDASQGDKPLAVITEVKTIGTGDYSIVGLEAEIAIERKSLSDAFSTFTHDRDRWIRELDRMASLDKAYVVIEAGWQEIIDGPNKLGGWKIGKTVYRSILAWQNRYPNVHWMPMPTRDIAEVTTFRILERFWKDREHAAKADSIA